MTLWKLGEAAADELDDRRRERLGEARAGSSVCVSPECSAYPRCRAPLRTITLPCVRPLARKVLPLGTDASHAPRSIPVHPSTGPERPLQRAGRVPPPPACSPLGISCKRSHAKAKASRSSAPRVKTPWAAMVRLAHPSCADSRTMPCILWQELSRSRRLQREPAGRSGAASHRPTLRMPGGG